MTNIESGTGTRPVVVGVGGSPCHLMPVIADLLIQEWHHPEGPVAVARTEQM